jgi:hypothetical protein
VHAERMSPDDEKWLLRLGGCGMNAPNDLHSETIVSMVNLTQQQRVGVVERVPYLEDARASISESAVCGRISRRMRRRYLIDAGGNSNIPQGARPPHNRRPAA